MATSMATAAGRRREGGRALARAEIGHRLGIVALGALLGGGPALAAAADAQAGQRPPARSGRLSIPAPTTSASILALLATPAPPVPAATFIVTTAADLVDPADGKLSLREAVGRANATGALDAIEFAAALEGQTLVLTGGELTVTQDLIIDGDRNDDGSEVTLSGGDASRVLNIRGTDTDTDVTLRDLTLTGGRAPEGEDGGAILLDFGDSLAMIGCTVSGSGVRGSDARGGGIYAAGYAGGRTRLTITDGRIVDNRTFSFGECGGGIGTGTDVALAIRRTLLAGNESYYSGGAACLEGSLVMEDSTVSNNFTRYGSCGGLSLNGTATIARSTIAGNSAHDNEGRAFGGGICAGGRLTLTDSTVAANSASGNTYGSGGGIAGGDLVIRNSTITGNRAFGGAPYAVEGGGILGSPVEVANSIVAGNSLVGSGATGDPNISGAIAASNGHNVFGSQVAGAVSGDREDVAPGALFAALDPVTGGGQLTAKGIVPLKAGLANPAVSAADPLAGGRFGQLGTTPRPRPAGSLPDLGAVEVSQPLSTGATLNNDVITGSAAANVLRGLAGNDLIRALQGNDTVGGDAGGDLLDGGSGNNRLDGGPGVDLVTFAFSAVPVAVDLGAGVARRGGDTDRLASIEGAIGTAKADRFTGDERDNRFQGGRGADRFAGGSGRDTYDLDRVQDSPPGAGASDRVGDFVPREDVLDLAGIDADPSLPGDQAFVWVGTGPLTAAGQLGFVRGATTVVRASTDADPAPELQVRLTGDKALTEGDFRL